MKLLARVFFASVSLAAAQEAPGTQAAAPEWVTQSVAAPRVQFRTFDSAAAKTKVSYHIYIPEAYDREKEHW